MQHANLHVSCFCWSQLGCMCKQQAKTDYYCYCSANSVIIHAQVSTVLVHVEQSHCLMDCPFVHVCLAYSDVTLNILCFAACHESAADESLHMHMDRHRWQTVQEVADVRYHHPYSGYLRIILSCKSILFFPKLHGDGVRCAFLQCPVP